MIRLLVVLLLAANVGLCGWRFDASLREQHRRQQLAASRLDVPRLQLIQELDAPPVRRESDSADPSATPPVELPVASVEVIYRCFEFGPFTEQSQAAVLTAAIPGMVETAWEVREGDIEQLFWVYLEPAASESEAEAQLAALTQSGITDTFLIRRGGLKNAISLGVFRSQDSVNRKFAEMAERGELPVVVPRRQARREYWLLARVDEAHAAQLLALSVPEAQLRRPIECPAATAGSAPGEDPDSS